MSKKRSFKTQGGRRDGGHKTQSATTGATASENLIPFKGIEVYVEVRGRSIGFDQIGKKGELQYGVLPDFGNEQIKLVARINPDCPALKAGRIVVFNRREDARVDVRVTSANKDGHMMHRQPVRISVANGGKKVSVDHATNNIYVAFLSPAGVWIKAVTVVRQGSRFYVLMQNQYTVEAFLKDDGSIALPGFYKHHGGLPEFARLDVVQNFFAGLSADAKDGLEHERKFVATELEHWTLGEDEIYVKLWTLRRNNGVGILKDGTQVRLFWADIKGEGPHALRTGQRVRFERLQPISEEQRQANRTTLRFDARGLTVID